ncbi:MAG: trimethylamine methyltransferase family protein [Anaerolineae bacterium]
MTNATPPRPRGRRERRRASPLAETPFRQLHNPNPPVEVRSAEQVERIHQASLHILETIGIEFWDEETLDLWAAAGGAG